MSKTTPCKVAGGRHCASSGLTCRANQRHLSTVQKSCLRSVPPSRAHRFAIAFETYPHLKLHRLAAANDRRAAEPGVCRVCRQNIDMNIARTVSDRAPRRRP
jgi:hypothetical protein